MEALSTEAAYRLLAEAPVAHIGLISDGRPYVTPMSFVLEGERVLFRTQPGQKFRAIEENPTVCVEASKYDADTGAWSSVIVMGTAEEVDDPATRQLTIQLLYAKYSDALGSPLNFGGNQPMAGFPHVVAVRIEEISGMSSGGGLTPRTRPGRL